MSNSLAIQVNSLSKTYSDGIIFRKRFEALKRVSFEVNKGEIFGLLGPNGAGKTTFLKILLGIIRKTDGDATMLGFPAGSRQGRSLCGYLPEHLRVPPHMTGYTALECFGNLSNIPTKIIRERQGELLSLVGLADRAKDRVSKYSKGMVQRLGLAQALLSEPQLLVLDEPTDGLDPRARADMRTTIRKLTKKGVTIFLNSHLLQEVEVLCDRVAILNHGEMKYCGKVSDVGEFINSDVSKTAASGSVANQISIQIEIEGDVDAINASFQGASFEIVEKISDNHFTVRSKVTDQDEVDALVDSLRQHSVSLIGLEKHRVSLEDAFLKIVGDTPKGT